MTQKRRPNDAINFFMEELAARVVAESGRPADRFHLGKLILQGLRDAPDFTLQVDGGTGETETCASVLERAVRCAESFRSLGLGVGDVIVLMAPNHIHLCVPFYAALFLGMPIAATDATLKLDEMRGAFAVTQPKIIFCQSAKASEIKAACDKDGLGSIIVTFDESDQFTSMTAMMDKHGGTITTENFRASDFDTQEAIVLLTATSGTTGLPKVAAVTHKNIAITSRYLWCGYETFPSPFTSALVVSPLQWLTALIVYILSPIVRIARVQTSRAMTRDHCYQLINTYKPATAILSPTFLTVLLKYPERNACNFSCFELIYLGGSAVALELVDDVKKVMPKVDVKNALAMSEIGLAFLFDPEQPINSNGKQHGCMQYKFIDCETGNETNEPHRPGELWVKGPGVFKGYYRNPEATKEAFSEDGWFKTGDVCYRDENHFYFYVDRLKMLLKYNNHQISPVELEGVIRRHPGVLDVAVSGIPDRECGDLPVAFVVRNGRCDVTAQEIKDLVKEKLTDTKQLRGGVVFLEELPLLPTTKLDRRKLKELALTLEKK